jgi:class 3 adenylate cyclase
MEVGAWLRSLGLGQYAPAFRANDIDAATLLRLTTVDLKDLGVTSVGHRRKLCDAIAALRGGSDRSIDLVDGGTDVPTAERRQLTILSCDLVGSTELAVRLDPEDLRKVMTAYHRACAEVVRRYAGHVGKYMSDGALAYFGHLRRTKTMWITPFEQGWSGSM